MPIITPDTASTAVAILIAVKAVPGAKRPGIAGPLGGRLKVRVAEPPEGGRANRAVCGLIARALGVPLRAAEVVRGHGGAEKLVRVEGVCAADAARALGLDVPRGPG